MNCHGENTLQPINKRMYFLNSCRISGHFDSKSTTIAQIEQILKESKDPKIGIILNLERVYFLVTRVIYGYTPISFLFMLVSELLQILPFRKGLGDGLL